MHECMYDTEGGKSTVPYDGHSSQWTGGPEMISSALETQFLSDKIISN
jgi:hypothetical protein